MVRRSGDVFRVGSLLAIGIFFVSIWALARFSRVAFETLHHAFSGKPRDPALFNSLSLGESQCNALFPGLTEEIDTAVARGPFDLKLGPEDYRGLVQGKIADGKVSLMSASSNMYQP